MHARTVISDVVYRNRQRVKKGQLLAEIDTPEVGSATRPRRSADLATARANEALSNTTTAR